MIKNLLKSRVNPTEIRVWITSVKLLRDGRVMVEASSKNDIETLGEKIEENVEKNWMLIFRNLEIQD
jgi:hypothetical protein